MDGLLIDSERVYTETTIEILRKYGKEPVFPMAVKSRMMGRPGPQARAEIFLEWSGLPITVEQYIEEQRSLQLERFPLVKPLPGADKLLKKLHAGEIPIALATSSTASNYALKSSNLKEFFSVFEDLRITGDDARILGRGKPQPDIFLHALTMVNQRYDTQIAPSQCLVFEDGIPGVQAGLAAGMHVVWVPDAEILALHRDEIDTILGDRGTMIMSLEDFDYTRYGL